MTDRITALREMEKAVEAGHRHLCPFWKVWMPESKDGHLAYLADAAFGGSLDAAKALHDAMLPEHTAMIGTRKPRAIVHDANDTPFIAFAETPARAWLLAIIRAIIARGCDK